MDATFLSSCGSKSEEKSKNNDAGDRVRSRRSTVPPLSHRTLQHPSFLPLYMAAGFPHHRTCCDERAVHPMSPDEIFYCDPNVSRGRIPNIVSELNVLECFRLNTPPPIMSACPAPPNRPDPFRSGPHPTREPGNLTFTVTSLHSPAQPCRLILELAQEEEQAITNLMKPHHQEPQMALNCVPIRCHQEPSSPAVGVHGLVQEGKCWSSVELEAANILLSRFSRMGRDHGKSAAALPDPLLYQSQGSGFVDGGSTDDKEYLSSVCGDFSKLSHLERDAVNILLGLKHMEALSTMQ